MSVWWVYVLESTSSARTYVGVAIDVERRLRQHNGELRGGARSTTAGRPWRLARREGPFERGAAQSIEHRLKRVKGRARIAATVER
jgi:predicted GIY-YIG superfamily endonuclease